MVEFVDDSENGFVYPDNWEGIQDIVQKLQDKINNSEWPKRISGDIMSVIKSVSLPHKALFYANMMPGEMYKTVDGDPTQYYIHADKPEPSMSILLSLDGKPTGQVIEGHDRVIIPLVRYVHDSLDSGKTSFNEWRRPGAFSRELMSGAMHISIDINRSFVGQLESSVMLTGAIIRGETGRADWRNFDSGWLYEAMGLVLNRHDMTPGRLADSMDECVLIMAPATLASLDNKVTPGSPVAELNIYTSAAVGLQSIFVVRPGADLGMCYDIDTPSIELQASFGRFSMKIGYEFGMCITDVASVCEVRPD